MGGAIAMSFGNKIFAAREPAGERYMHSKCMGRAAVQRRLATRI